MNYIALIENLVRDNLSPIEEAQAYMNRWEKMEHKNTENFKYEEIAYALSKELPKSSQHIYNKISLLKLPENIQNAIHFFIFSIILFLFQSVKSAIFKNFNFIIYG